LDQFLASVDSAGNVTFGVGDPNNTTMATTNSAGSVSARLDYEPYGQTTGSAPVAFPFTYTGHIPIVGNILYYRNRFYDAGVGRFLSEDPLDFQGGVNLYSYVRGNPITGTDPQGLFKFQGCESPISIPNPIEVKEGVRDVRIGYRLNEYGKTIDKTVDGVELGEVIQGIGGLYTINGLRKIGIAPWEIYEWGDFVECLDQPFGYLDRSNPFGAYGRFGELYEGKPPEEICGGPNSAACVNIKAPTNLNSPPSSAKIM
jgi:RHS repeat-associated protein